MLICFVDRFISCFVDQFISCFVDRFISCFVQIVSLPGLQIVSLPGLQAIASRPQPLQMLCRRVIREAARTPMFPMLLRMSVPRMLRDFLLMDELDSLVSWPGTEHSASNTTK